MTRTGRSSGSCRIKAPARYLERLRRIWVVTNKGDDQMVFFKKLVKYGQDRLIVGLVSVLSFSFLESAPLEKNPQDCAMISLVSKRRKDEPSARKDEESLPD